MNPWIAFDLDGTLAEYDGWSGPDHVGAPIPAMVERWKQHRAMGHDCRIMTARVSTRSEEELKIVVAAIEAWCRKHLGEIPLVTCKKDYGMLWLYDDRCIQVEKNTGRILGHDPFPVDALP